MSSFHTEYGRELRDVRVGYETYGSLSQDRSNVILVTQPFSLTSHAAGRYASDDPAPGYWDMLIGAGAPIDTDRYFVISVNTLANVNANDPEVVTTGPASLDPATGKPYGLDFPTVTIGDFVRVQRALLSSLGIDRVHAVIGASMGAMQAIEWATAFPGDVDRVVAVADTAMADAWLIGWGHVAGEVVKLDPLWNDGDYYGSRPPLDGLATALQIILLQAHHPVWADKTFERRRAIPDRDPGADLENQFAVEEWLDRVARAQVQSMDANSFLYLIKALQLFVAGHGDTLEAGLARIHAPVLLVPMASDQLVFIDNARRDRDLLRQLGKDVQYFEVQGSNGHADDVLSIEQAGMTIRRFLAERLAGPDTR